MTTKEKVESKVEELLSKPYRLDLHNDDKNSFDHVINCLMKFCNHEYEQASQCANIVHYKGVCDVKYGDYDTLNDIKDKMRASGLSVTLEAN